VKGVVQVFLADCILFDQIHEAAVFYGAGWTSLVYIMIGKAVSVKRMVAQAVNRWQIQLVTTVFTAVGLEDDWLGLEMIDFTFQIHNALKMSINNLLIFFDLFFFFPHAFKQILL